MHLAELNIGRLRYPKGDARVAEFIDNLQRINGVAERTKGYVWRVKDESGDATEMPYSDDPAMIANLSVWETIADLQSYVFQTVHTGFYRKRAQWFAPLVGPHFVMWWIEPGHRPNFAEGAAKLAQLAKDGPGEGVFGWADTEFAENWRQARCA